MWSWTILKESTVFWTHLFNSWTQVNWINLSNLEPLIHIRQTIEFWGKGDSFSTESENSELHSVYWIELIVYLITFLRYSSYWSQYFVKALSIVFFKFVVFQAIWQCWIFARVLFIILLFISVWESVSNWVESVQNWVHVPVKNPTRVWILSFIVFCLPMWFTHFEQKS